MESSYSIGVFLVPWLILEYWETCLMVRYFSLVLIRITHGTITYLTNLVANQLTNSKIDTVADIMQGSIQSTKSEILRAFLSSTFIKLHLLYSHLCLHRCGCKWSCKRLFHMPVFTIALFSDYHVSYNF